MNEQLPNQGPQEIPEVPPSREETETQLVVLASTEISLRGLHAVFTIGAINATRTWRRLRGGTLPSEEQQDSKQQPDDEAPSGNS